VESGEWRVESRGEAARANASLHPSSFILHPSLSPRRPGFTLIELLVTITIIGIIAGMSMAALQWSRRFAAEHKTKATIAKLDAIISKKYESYVNRRMPINTREIYNFFLNFYQTQTPGDLKNPQKALHQTQWARLDALRDMMRMELPFCEQDVRASPYQLSWENPSQANAREPAVHKSYQRNCPWNSNGVGDDFQSAQCLYLIVSSKPEDLELFSENEFGFVVDSNGKAHKVFVDGWGTPIRFLRWAPSYLPVDALGNPTGIATTQTGDPKEDHDPFDPNQLDQYAYKLTPLIYSAGPDKIFSVNIHAYFDLVADPDDNTKTIKHLYNCYGTALPVGEKNASDAAGIFDNITNHQIETQ
jgi:prepilin-type N-terminal cleavage/methylation domain-containing protein